MRIVWFLSIAVGGGRDPRRRGRSAAARGLQGKATPKPTIVTSFEVTGRHCVFQRDYASHAQGTVPSRSGGRYLPRGRPGVRHRGRVAERAHRHHEVPIFEQDQAWPAGRLHESRPRCASAEANLASSSSMAWRPSACPGRKGMPVPPTRTCAKSGMRCRRGHGAGERCRHPSDGLPPMVNAAG